MKEEILRPPLPAYASHDGIRFLCGVVPPPPISEETVAAIGAALSFLLPQRDFSVSGSGRFIFHQETEVSTWQRTGLLEGTMRDPG